MTNEWAHKVQGATLVTADHLGERWTRAEVEIVATFTDDVPDAELAITLGRSLYAIWAIQHRMRTVGVEGVLAAFDTPKRVAPTCPTHNIALTAMGACDWC